jgi:hypothetical protein
MVVSLRFGECRDQLDAERDVQAACEGWYQPGFTNYLANFARPRSSSASPRWEANKRVFKRSRIPLRPTVSTTWVASMTRLRQ